MLCLSGFELYSRWVPLSQPYLYWPSFEWCVMWICNWLALLYISLFPDVDLKEKISMVKNGTKLQINIFVLTVEQEDKEHMQVGQLLSRLLHIMLPTSETLNNICNCLKITETWCPRFSSTDLNMWSSISDNILESYFQSDIRQQADGELDWSLHVRWPWQQLGACSMTCIVTLRIKEKHGINSFMIANLLDFAF